ncbi:MAG: DUF1801 domain-containing protein [Bacteroidota bacterium]
MRSTDKRIDAYIARSAEFARPILSHLRKVVHRACPEVQETIKWGFPHFEYHGILCSMAAFKQHCSFGFWKATQLSDPDGILSRIGKTSMGQFGRLTNLSDIPSEAILAKYIREAMRLNEGGTTLPVQRRSKRKKPLRIPPYFARAIRANPKASRVFKNFSPSMKREYVEWVTEAKTDATRQKRLTTAVVWIAQGKNRNWKYEK